MGRASGKEAKALKTHPSWKPIAVLLALFAASFAIHLAAGGFLPKAAGIVPDEYYFAYTASSLVQGSPLSQLGEHGEKFVYPLLISPAFGLFSDFNGQLGAVNFINSLFAAACVFPAFLLSRRILSGSRVEKLAFAFAAIAAFLPDTFYSTAIMAEPVAVFAGLWWLYAASTLLGDSTDAKRRLAAIAAFAAGTYVLYSLKEYFAVYFVAFAVCLVISAVKYAKSADATSAEKDLAQRSAIVFVAIFIVCYVVGQLAFFGSLGGNAYSSQLSGKALSAFFPLGILYLIITAIHLWVASGVLPLSVPIWRKSRNFDSGNAALGLFAVIALVLMLVVVLFTVTLQEEHTLTIRIIFRYYNLLLLLAAMLAVKKVSACDVEEIADIARSKTGMVVSAVFAVAVMCVFGFMVCDSEGSSILWLTTLFGLFGFDGAGGLAWGGALAIRLGLLAACAVPLVAARRSKLDGNVLACAFCAVLGLSCAISSGFLVDAMNTSHALSEKEATSGDAIVEMVNEMMDSGEVVGNISLFGRPQDLYNHYYSFAAESRYVTLRLQSEAGESYAIEPKTGSAFGNAPDGLNYAVVVDKTSIKDVSDYGIDGADLVLDTDDTAVYLYCYE